MSKTPNTDAAARARALPKASVPKAASGPKIPEAGYLVEEIGDGLFWVADGVFQMMFVVTDEGVVAVDAPPSLGHNILRAIRGVTSKPVTGLVYNHAHGDHIGAASVFPDGIPRYAHRRPPRPSRRRPIRTGRCRPRCSRTR